MIFFFSSRKLVSSLTLPTDGFYFQFEVVGRGKMDDFFFFFLKTLFCRRLCQLFRTQFWGWGSSFRRGGAWLMEKDEEETLSHEVTR